MSEAINSCVRAAMMRSSSYYADVRNRARMLMMWEHRNYINGETGQ
jgi:hypothetical protein